MLIDQLVVLGANELKALIHDRMLFLICDLGLLLLNQKLVVVDLNNYHKPRKIALTLSFFIRSETFCFCLLFI
jgi:hypothetical protein